MDRTAGEELIQDEPQAVHVGRDSDGLASDLLRACILRGQHAEAAGSHACIRIGLDKCGNAKIQQARSALPVDQNVARLQVTVNGVALVRVLYCLADLKEQTQPRP